MKRTLLTICVAALVWGCGDLFDGDGNKVKIIASQAESDLLFTGLPIEFSASTATSPAIFVEKWSFGDGASSTESASVHTYYSPGSYQVKAKGNNRGLSGDTTIVIHPPLTLIGSETTSENGKFIFEDPAGGYKIVHTLNSGSSVDDWMFLSTTAAFSMMNTNKLPFDSYAEVFEMSTNKKGNIIMTSTMGIKELALNGTVLKGTPQSGTVVVRMVETTDGYLASAWHFTIPGTLAIKRLNQDFAQLSEVQMEVRRTGYDISDHHIEPDGTLRLHYYDNTVQQNRTRLFVKKDLIGNTLLEKQYSPDIGVGSSFRLSSGYLFRGSKTTNFNSKGWFVFTRVNENGDVLWSVTSPFESKYPEYIHGNRMVVIEDGTSVIIFFDNQKGIKVGQSGEVMWSKRFGLSDDTFNAAIKNKEGNIVLLGAHQYDYTKKDFTSDYQKRDLVLMEIDTDGNLVN